LYDRIVTEEVDKIGMHEYIEPVRIKIKFHYETNGRTDRNNALALYRGHTTVTTREAINFVPFSAYGITYLITHKSKPSTDQKGSCFYIRAREGYCDVS
jgi:hypothetical protein